MGAVLLKLLALFSFLCFPSQRFSPSDMRVLRAEYDAAPVYVPQHDLAWFSDITNAEIHIDALLALMRLHPTWVLSPEALAVLNNERKLTRRIGFGVYKLLTEGADCPCCSGWRAVLLAVASAVAASVVTLILTRSVSWFH